MPERHNVGGSDERVRLPAQALVVLAGASGSGKSTFARAHFAVEQIVGVDEARTRRGVCVIDAPHVTRASRAPLVALARELSRPLVLIALDLPTRVCEERLRMRGDDVREVHGQGEALQRSLPTLAREGFAHVVVLSSVEDIDAFALSAPRDDRGPFDIIGDVHGCKRELDALFDELGYVVDARAGRQHPLGRRAVFVGDLVDRGPDVLGVLELVIRMVDAGQALCVRGNHEDKLLRKLRTVRLGPTDLRAQIMAFIAALAPQLVLDDGMLIVTHEPPRAEPRIGTLVVHGHTTVDAVALLGHTICIDTGCVYGGRLTALRYPERELVSVAAVLSTR